MSKYKVALLTVFAPEVLAELRRRLPPDFELVSLSAFDEREALDKAAGADFILAGAVKISSQVMDAAPKLRLIQKWGIGYDSIDVRAAAERGVPVAITAGAASVAVAELAILLMLAVYRRLPYVDRNLRQGRWLKTQMRACCYQLNGKTVGLVGLGNIGREVAKRVRAFNAQVIYYDKMRPAPPVEEELGVKFSPLDDLFAQADIISLHVPLNDETRALVDAKALSLMKPMAVVINSCRGGVVDESALADALRSGRIMGAGLDVFLVEPPAPDNPLLALDNVVLTSHIGGGVMDNVVNVAEHAFSNMLRVLNGEPLPVADVVKP